MYLSLRNRPVAPGQARSGPVPRTVVLLGFTSLFTDISSEMVAAVLPLFLTLQLGLSPVAYGFIDGLYNGASAVSRLGAGILADRLRNAKAVAVVGYGLSAATRPLMLLVGSATGVASLVAVDRVGKGIRTAPRDAMISHASAPADLGRNFGVHRAMDNVGAMLGPLLAFAILMALPSQYSAVFVVSTVAAFLGLAVLVLLVPSQRRRRAQQADAPDAVPAVRVRDLLRSFTAPQFARLAGVAGLLSLFTVSDAFLFLSLLERNDDLAAWFPLLAVGLALTYTVLAVPIGRAADRYGRILVFLLGHTVLFAVYLLVGGPLGSSVLAVALVLALLGLFYAATDGVLAASVSAVVPAGSRASGLAAAQTVVALAAFASSVVFGLLLMAIGWSQAYLVMGAGLAVAVVVAWRLLPRLETGAVR
jgi:MFS family permease